MVDKYAIEIISKYIESCKSFGIDFYKVILFGSYAKGNFTDNSDIDLALVSDKFTDYPISDRKKIVKANIKFSVIEPHTFSKYYFLQGDPFIDEIKKTGIEIAV
jgi:predicted nucleotidyltransferase